jgi:hypothetical protein
MMSSPRVRPPVSLRVNPGVSSRVCPGVSPAVGPRRAAPCTFSPASR